MEHDDEQRLMTGAERIWWNALKRVLRKMPQSVELNARIGEIGIAPSGARCLRTDRDGHYDWLSDDEWAAVDVPRLDGRDSHL